MLCLAAARLNLNSMLFFSWHQTQGIDSWTIIMEAKRLDSADQSSSTLLDRNEFAFWKPVVRYFADDFTLRLLCTTLATHLMFNERWTLFIFPVPERLLSRGDHSAQGDSASLEPDFWFYGLFSSKLTITSRVGSRGWNTSQEVISSSPRKLMPFAGLKMHFLSSMNFVTKFALEL